MIKSKIKKTCELYKKNQERVNLIAVSKTIDKDKIIEAIAAGCKYFGENYIKEAKEKWVEIRREFPEIKLHFIGNLQSNKVGEAVDLFDVIHVLDSSKLALALKKEIVKKQKNPQIFIQVNIGEEPQKNGVLPAELNSLVKFSRDELGLNIIGLMCIPPNNEDPSAYFALLAKLAKDNNLEQLSMGMSEDFDKAIAMNATHIRLGTAIFGKRVNID